jgi:hypothetical protein
VLFRLKGGINIHGIGEIDASSVIGQTGINMLARNADV